jgi:hypothetical protein
MSQKFRIKNDKGLFVDVRAWGLLSVATLSALRLEILPTMPKGDRAPYVEALDAMARLPVVKSHLDINRFDSNFDPVAEADYLKNKAKKSWTSRPRCIMDAYGWLMPEVAKGASSGSGIEFHSAEAAGWLAIGAVANKISWINALLEKAGIDAVSDSYLRGAKSAAKRAKELVFEPIDAFSELAATEAWMLFVGTGFMDDKGNVGPLGRARMFESAKAASKTANARGLHQWKVVKGAVELKALEDFPGDSVPDKLAQAISMRESELIRQALQSASLDALKTRLAELEEKFGQVGQEPGEPSVVVSTARKARL